MKFILKDIKNFILHSYKNVSVKNVFGVHIDSLNDIYE